MTPETLLARLHEDRAAIASLVDQGWPLHWTLEAVDEAIDHLMAIMAFRARREEA